MDWKQRKKQCLSKRRYFINEGACIGRKKTKYCHGTLLHPLSLFLNDANSCYATLSFVRQRELMATLTTVIP